MKIFTFCVDIGRVSKENLKRICKVFILNLKRYVKEFSLVIFTNFDLEIEDPAINICNYYDNSIKIYQQYWKQMSFNKFFIFKDLYDKFNDNFLWIDLDTQITSDISYIDDFSNFFLTTGGDCEDMINVTVGGEFKVQRKNYIQGDIWKLNIELWHELLKTFEELKSKEIYLEYDCQDLFNYYIYFKNSNQDKFNILGRNLHPNTINGLSIWNKAGNAHPNIVGLNNLYYENGELKSKFYPDKSIHILSFTFETIVGLYHTKKFKELFDLPIDKA